MQEILKYLKQRGERLDCEIAAGTGIPLAEVRHHLSELSKRGDVIECRSTRFIDGEKREGVLCRIAGYIPQAAPGRKPTAKARKGCDGHSGV
jgi:DNA-binding transcriptional ArsR family regulator